MKTVLILLLFLSVTALGQSDSTHVGPPDQKLRITHKPRPAYADQTNGAVCIQGMVVLRVQFLENGEIGKITVVKGLPYGLTENAIDAAKRMKFEPAKKDGRAVTVLRPVEFSFSIY